jgi:hypothetical protein
MLTDGDARNPHAFGCFWMCKFQLHPMTHHVFTCWVGRADASFCTPIDVTTGGAEELTNDSNKRPIGRLLIPVPPPLSLASFDFDVKKTSKRPNC